MPGTDLPALRITQERDGDGTVLRLAGELDLATADQLRARLADAAAVRRVVVDLAGLDFLDVAGLNTLLEANRNLAAHGGRLLLRRPRPMVLRMLGLLGLDDAVEIQA